MDSLRKLIAEKTQYLSSTEIPHKLEIDFFEEFLRLYSVYNFDSYENVSNAAYFMAVLSANKINMSFQELVEHIQIIEDFVNNFAFDVTLYGAYIDSLAEINELGLLDKIIKRENLSKLDAKSKKVYNTYKKYCKKLFLIDKDGREEYDYKINNTFEKLFYSLPQPKKFSSFTELYIIVDELKSVLKEYIDNGFNDVANDDMFDDFEKSVFKGRHFTRFLEKEKSKLINMHIKEFIELNEMSLTEEYEIMRKHYESILKEAKEVVKTTNKKIKALEELEYKLKYIKPERLLKLDSSVDELLFDSEIRYHYLLLMLSHNNNIYQKEEQKNIEFNNNSLTKLEIIFSKYGFNFNDFSEEEKESIVNETTISQVENILNSIKYSEISFISDYVGEFAKVIIFSKPEVIKFIDYLLKNKIIDKKFIFRNIDILCSTHTFDRFYNNINYLSSIGINIVNVFKDDPNILLLDSEELVTRTNILSEYSLKLDKNDIYNFDFLMDDKILDLIDNYIELGLKDIILENPKYLNSNGFDTIKRIMICNLIGVNPINKSNKIVGSVNTGNNFYVEPDKYDNFIINYKHDYQNSKCVEILNNNKRNVISQSTRNRLFVKRLDELYMKDELTYVINGVVISRNRVLRNLDVLIKHLFFSELEVSDLVFQSILYNMNNNIEPEVLEKIYNLIFEIEEYFERPKTYTLK